MLLVTYTSVTLNHECVYYIQCSTVIKHDFCHLPSIYVNHLYDSHARDFQYNNTAYTKGNMCMNRLGRVRTSGVPNDRGI